MVIFHVPHVDIHQGRTGEKMGRLSGNNRDGIVGTLAQFAGRCDTGNAISKDDYVTHDRPIATQTVSKQSAVPDKT